MWEGQSGVMGLEGWEMEYYSVLAWFVDSDLCWC